MIDVSDAALNPAFNVFIIFSVISACFAGAVVHRTADCPADQDLRLGLCHHQQCSHLFGKYDIMIHCYLKLIVRQDQSWHAFLC